MSKNLFIPERDLALSQFKKYFLNRQDWVAGLMRWKRPQPLVGNTDKTDYLDALLLSHLFGEQGEKAVALYQKKRKGKVTWYNEKNYYRIGAYCPAPPDNLTKWTCIDFDGGEAHASSLKKPLTAALECQAICNSIGIPSYLEKSGGGAGWHIFIFFTEPIPASVARRLGFLIAPRGQITNAGDIADPKRNQGIEIFPKQERLTKKGFGNLVWMPFWSGAASQANIFYKETSEPGAVTPVLYKSFDTVSLEAVESGIKEREDALRKEMPAGIDPEKHPAGKPDKHKPVSKPAPTSASDKEKWIVWREAALEALDIETFYQSILTGSISGQGWMEARAHDSPTGDRSPSAGVATGSGDAERGTYHNFRTSETFSIFDYCVEVGKVANNKDALKFIAKITGVPLPEVSRKKSQASSGKDGAKSSGGKTSSPPDRRQPRRKPRRPQIQVNARSLDAIVRDTWQAIHGSNKRPHLFSRGNDLVKLSDGKTGKFIQELNLAKAHGFITRWATFLKVSENSVIEMIPPKDIASDILNFPDAKALPKLDTVISSPVFNAKGKLITEPGYQPSIFTWNEPAPELAGLAISDQPTLAQVENAKRLLFDNLLGDFTFVSKADRNHFLGALLTPFIRPMFSGSIPLHLIEAPTPGTGKSLLCNILSMIVKGRPAEAKALSRSEDEIRKALTAELKDGASIVVIDNVTERRAVDSPTLASILTAEIWSDRILGETRIIQVRNLALWLMTSNNPRLSLEIARRTLRVRLDPKCDRPWQRIGFKHPNILQWTKNNRRQLVEAILTLIQFWLYRGAILGKGSIGGFEIWAAIMSGIMESIGELEYLTNTNELYDNADEESEQWRDFCAVWHETNGDNPQTVAELVLLAEQTQFLGDVIGDRTERSKVTRLGKALHRNKDRQYGDYRIEKGVIDKHTHKKTWQVTYLGEGRGYSVSGSIRNSGEQIDQGDLFSFDTATDMPSQDKVALSATHPLETVSMEPDDLDNNGSVDVESLSGKNFFNVSGKLETENLQVTDNTNFAKRAKRAKTTFRKKEDSQVTDNTNFAKRAKRAKRFIPYLHTRDLNKKRTPRHGDTHKKEPMDNIYNKGLDVSHVSHVSKVVDNTKEMPETPTFRKVSHVSQAQKNQRVKANIDIIDEDGNPLSMEQLFPIDNENKNPDENEK